MCSLLTILLLLACFYFFLINSLQWKLFLLHYYNSWEINREKICDTSLVFDVYGQMKYFLILFDTIYQIILINLCCKQSILQWFSWLSSCVGVFSPDYENDSVFSIFILCLFHSCLHFLIHRTTPCTSHVSHIFAFIFPSISECPVMFRRIFCYSVTFYHLVFHFLCKVLSLLLF